MVDRISCSKYVRCALAILVPVGAVAADGDQLIATIDKPAVVTAAPSSGPDESTRVVISVTGFQPAQDGAVQAVVKAQSPDGTEQEIGRFGIFPQTKFEADPSGAQRYSVPLPKHLASRTSVTLKVELVPVTGKGLDARLKVESAEIR